MAWLDGPASHVTVSALHLKSTVDLLRISSRGVLVLCSQGMWQKASRMAPGDPQILEFMPLCDPFPLVQTRLSDLFLMNKIHPKK